MSRRSPNVAYIAKSLTSTPRTLDPSALTIHERKLVTSFLRLETNFTYSKIAQILDLSLRQVMNYAKEMHCATSRAWPINDTEKIAREYISRANILKERARAAGDGWLEWKIECDLLDRLAKMGYVNYKAEPLTLIPQIHIGDNVSITSNQIEKNDVKILVDALAPEQKQKLLEAYRAAGIDTGE